MRDIKYIGSAAYTDNFFGSGKTWAYTGQIHEVEDIVATKLLASPVFVEVDADPLFAVSVNGGTQIQALRGATLPQVRAQYAAQSATPFEAPDLATDFEDIPGTSVTLTNLTAGSLVAIHVQATMVTDAGTVTVAIHDGTTAINVLASTATTAETRVATPGSAVGVVQTGATGSLVIIPISAAGTKTFKLQAKHAGATSPVVTAAALRAMVVGV
jgi:hypothetical protein